MQTNYLTLTVAILGAAKLVLNAFGVDIISDNDINNIANGVAAVISIVGVYMNHHQTPPSPPSA